MYGWRSATCRKLSAFLQLQSGQHVSIGTAAPLVGRDSLQGPGLADWDLRLTRDIPLEKQVRMRLVFEGFDIVNHANFATFQNNLYTFKSGVFTPTTNYLTNLTMLPQ